MTDTTFRQGMTMLAAVWPEKAPAAETVAAYWLALSDLTDDEWRAACQAAVKTSKWFPKPAELRELARPTAPPRDPELDFDLMAGARANAAINRLSAPLQLPPIATSIEERERREAHRAALREQTLAAIRQAKASLPSAPRPRERRRPPSYTQQAEADAILSSLPRQEQAS